MKNFHVLKARKSAEDIEAKISGPTYFDSSLVEEVTTHPFITGMLFEVVMSYRRIEGKDVHDGTTIEFILCLSWEDLVSYLPDMVKSEAESWKGAVFAEVKSVRFLDTSVLMSPNLQSVLLSHLTGEDG